MLTRRLTFLALTWLLLLALLSRLLGGLGALLNPAALGYVLILPWLAALVAHGPREVAAALADAFDRRPEDLPHERRRVSAAVLRTVGGAALASGLIALLAAMIQSFNAIAASGGSASPVQVVAGMSTGFVAPLCGLALRSYLLVPLAEGIEAGVSAGASPSDEREHVPATPDSGH